MMRDFLYRLRRGPDARELMDGLSREARAGGPGEARGSAPPGHISPEQGEGAARVSAPLTNAEVSVLISVDNTLARRDQRTGRSLTRLQKALVAAAHASLRAATRLEAARANPRWVNGGLAPDSESGMTPGPEHEDMRQPSPARRTWRGSGPGPRPRQNGRAFQEMFDPHQPLITERVLLVIEAVFVLVEFAFWYGVFSGNLDRNTPLLDPVRISDVLLAIMVPLSGIVAARVVGGLTHRAICRHPGVGRKEYIGAAVSAVVAILAIYAIFSLVNARFDASSQLGATNLPSLAMTLIFIVVLLGDMVARIFLVSEIRAQTDKWLRHLDKIKTVAIRANQRHCESWTDLRSAVEVQLDQCERIVAAGARIISDQRSRRGAPAPMVPVASETASRPAHAGAPGPDTVGGPMALPSAELLQLYGVTLTLGPLRVIGDAIDTLGKWPPQGPGELRGQLNNVLARLYRLQNTGTGPATKSAVTPEDPAGHFKPPTSTPIDPPRRPVDEVNGATPADDQERGYRSDPA